MQAIDDLVFETYTKRTGEPSWVFEEFAAKVADIVARRCAEIAERAYQRTGRVVASDIAVSICREFSVPAPPTDYKEQL